MSTLLGNITCRIGTIAISIIIVFSSISAFSQEKQPETDYRKIFGSNYTYAENMLDINSWWADTLEEHGLEPSFAQAIVFPELIRYSSILDYIEIKALEVLYVQYGEDYADFSIGYFQMKPSFAEHIERDIIRFDIEEFYPELALLRSDTVDDPAHRTARIGRLQDEYFQLLYLEAFIRIMDLLNYNYNIHMSTEMKLQYYSTSYNTGYFKNLAGIRDEMGKKRFYCGLSEPGDRYSYAEISLFYYHSKSY